MKSPTGAQPGDAVLLDATGQDELPGDNAILNLLSFGVYACDANGIIRKYNQQAVALWGQLPVADDSNQRYCGPVKLYLIDGTNLPIESTPVAECLSIGQPVKDIELVMERLDQSRLIVKMTVVPTTNNIGAVTGALISFQDITQSEYKLRESEKNLHRMIGEVEDYAIFMLNKDGIIQNWNKGAEKIKGYKEEEILGKHLSIFYTPEDNEKRIPYKLLHEAEVNGKALSEGWRMRKDGTRVWASIVLTALHDSRNNVIGFSKVTRDLTERKLAEDKIKQNNADLEFQNKELEQFAYAAAHDLKEPLRKIQFYNNFIADTIGEELPDKQKDYLSRSINAASRMQGLIDDLLTYSKTSNFSLQFEEVNFNTIVDEVLALHHTTIEKAGALVKKTSLPILHGIPFQCTQLLDNLIGNALKYRHPHRTPSISISAEKVSGSAIQENQIHKQKEYYKITIADNGIGFEPGHADLIFNLFQRLHGSGAFSGSGIGLAICKRIVQNHKGFINAKGSPDQGATFNIYFPC